MGLRGRLWGRGFDTRPLVRLATVVRVDVALSLMPSALVAALPPRLDLASADLRFISTVTPGALALREVAEVAGTVFESLAKLLEVLDGVGEGRGAGKSFVGPADKLDTEVDNDLLFVVQIFHADVLATSCPH